MAYDTFPSFSSLRFGTKLLLLNLGLMLANFLAGLLGLQMAAPPGYATVIWPPSGLAVAAVIFFGAGLLPGVFIASLLINLYIGGTTPTALAVALVIAFGSTLQAYAALLLLRRYFGREINLPSWPSLAGAMAIAAPGTCVIAATVGTGALFGFGFVSASDVPQNWLTWWIGDTIGVMVFLPLALLAPGVKAPISFMQIELRSFTAISVFSVLLPLGISFYSYMLVSHLNFQRAHSDFETITEDNRFSLSFRFAKYEQALDAGVAIFDGADEITLPEWQRYFTTAQLMENLAGINGMGFIEFVREGELEAFLADADADGVGGLEVKGEGPEHFIIKYIVPVAPNEKAVGLNIAFEESRYAAAVRSAETGEARITNRIVLVQDKTKSVGFLILKPLYARDLPLSSPEERRRALLGWVYAPLVSHVFLSDLTSRQGLDFNLRIYDGPTVDEERLIFADQTGLDPSRSDYSRQMTFDVLGVPWTLVWDSLPAFDQRHRSILPFVLLGLGIVVSALSGSLIMSYSRREDAIREQVRNQTDVIAARERMSQSLLDTAHCAILMVGGDGIVRLANSYAGHLVDSPERVDLAGRKLGDIVPAFKTLNLGQIGEEGKRLSDQAVEINTKNDHRVFNFHITPWRDHKDRPRFTVLGDDVTLQKSHERALETNNRRWLTALSGSGIGVFEIDLETQTSIVNDTWWNIFGHTPSDEDPQAFFMAHINQDDAKRLFENDRRCIAGEIQTSVTDVRFLHSSGDWRWLRSHANVNTYDQKGTPTRLIGTQFDVTKLKNAEAELQESLETFRVAHEGAPVGIALIDGSGRMTRVNTALCTMSERHKDELLAASRGELCALTDRDKVLGAFQEAEANPGESVSCEWQLVKKTGETTWVRSSIALARADGGARALFVETYEDIDAARKLDQLKNEFVSTVSHELRTPLTAIRGALWLISREVNAEGENKAASLLDIASSNCEQLIYLVNDILDTEKLASGEVDFDFARHNVEELLLEAVEANRTYAIERKIRTELDLNSPNANANVDAGRFRQVVSNLLSNAIKFSPESSAVQVRSRRVGAHIRIEVADSGPGISEQMQEIVFDRFKQLRQSQMDKQNGSGLGLYISQMIMRGMHGRIGVDSTKGEGSIFWLELPLADGE